MLLREDAEAIATAKKGAYIKTQVIKLIPNALKKLGRRPIILNLILVFG